MIKSKNNNKTSWKVLKHPLTICFFGITRVIYLLTVLKNIKILLCIYIYTHTHTHIYPQEHDRKSIFHLSKGNIH